MKTVAVISQKGGSGKTTLTLNLGVAAQLAGKETVIADMDEQASAAMWFQARQNFCEDPLPHVVTTEADSLASLHAEAERQGVDYLFIDTAPQSNNPAISAAELADCILITCKPSVMDLRAVQNTISLISMASLKPGARVYMVLTMVEHFSKRESEEAASILKQLDMSVLPGWMGQRVAYRHSLINGHGVLEYEPSGKAAEEVLRIFKHVEKITAKAKREQDHKIAS